MRRDNNNQHTNPKRITAVSERQSGNIRARLVDCLIADNVFWSYDGVIADMIDDETLISKTLQYLDLDEINDLFQLFTKAQIKKVWLDMLIPQGEYLYTLNKFLAWYYFDAKCPGKYVKEMETKFMNKVSA